MIPKSQASRIADEVIEAGRRDRAWRDGFTRPLPHWFRGAHLAGLSDVQRHARFDEMSRRALGRPGWATVALSIMAAIVVPALFFTRLPVIALAASPAILIARHVALRREFDKDARAFAANAAPAQPLPREDA